MLAIDGDRVKPQQVLLNLILDPFEAMNEVSSDARHLETSTSLEGVTLCAGPGEGLTHWVRAGMHQPDIRGVLRHQIHEAGNGAFDLPLHHWGLGGQLSAQPNQPRGAIIELRLPAVGVRDIAAAHARSNPGYLRTH